jgi:hypothetical protein
MSSKALSLRLISSLRERANCRHTASRVLTWRNTRLRRTAVTGAACILSAFFLYRFSLQTHAQFGELFKSLFDQYRSKLQLDDVLQRVEELRGAPYVDISDREKYQIIWRFLRWQRIRDEAAGRNFKVKDWPRR